jgi:hypothetical protein
VADAPDHALAPRDELVLLLDLGVDRFLKHGPILDPLRFFDAVLDGGDLETVPLGIELFETAPLIDQR